MKKIASLILSLLLLVSMTLQYDIIAVGDSSVYDREFVIKSSVKFSASGRAWSFTEDEKVVSLYMNNSWQTVHLINSSYPFENVTSDEDGNAITFLDLPKIEQGQSIEYTIFYQAVSKPRELPNINENDASTLSDITDDLKTAYCGNSRTWMTNNIEVQRLAENLTTDETNVLVIVEKFVGWIWKEIRYPESNPAVSHEVPLYPNETLFYKEGDCDDQSILFISLCRIIGIPAYLQIGCIYTPGLDDDSFGWNGHIENVQKRIGWHGWAVVYIPPWGWLPVDLTYSSRDGPLTAIETAAVTSQDVIQYMKIANSDYVSNSREYREFLESNDFHIRTYDEIIPGRGTDSLGLLLGSLMKHTLAAFLFAGIVAGSALGLFYIKRMKRVYQLR